MGLRAGTLGLGLALAAAGAAAAGTEREPSSGTPAVVIQAPDGWQVTRDANGLYVMNVPKGVGLVITVAAEKPETSLLQVSEAAFAVSKCARIGKSEPALLGGRRAEAFSCQPEGDRMMPLKAIMVRPDAGHVVSVSRMLLKTATAPDIAQLDAAIASIRIEAAAP